MSWTVYCHTHIESNRKYVGLTKRSMERRWAQHCTQAKSSKGGRWHFPNAIRKYGPGAFKPDILGVYDSLEEASIEEERLIDEWDLRNPEKGFNLAKGGEHKPHPIRKNPWDDSEYRAKQLARPNIFNTPEVRAKNKAALNTPESKAKRSISSREVHSRPEVQIKLSLSSRGRKYPGRTKSSFAGRKHTEATLAKLRIANVGNTYSKGRNLSNKNALGYKQTAETRRKIAEASRASAVVVSQKNRRYVITDGVITHKVCKVHGLVLVAECIVGAYSNGKPRITCKVCNRGA